MSIKSNLDYWNISLQNPDRIGEEYYRRDKVIIRDAFYIKNIDKLRELIITYCTLKDLGRGEIMNVVVDIDRILKKVKNIQYTEFVAYWKCLDMTFSVYKDIENGELRRKILIDILDEYCARRCKLYNKLGYSHIVQQSLYDNASSRSQGVSGVNKLQAILYKVTGKKISEVSDIDEFQALPVCQMIPKTDSFKELMRNLNAEYRFGRDRQGKIPDLIIKFRNTVLVIEAKHIKEPGGSQDKQLNELIAYIRYQEPPESPVSYVAFLDGIYLSLIAYAPKGNKLYKQRVDIEEALKQNPRNYFVNTRGLCELLRDVYREYGTQV